MVSAAVFAARSCFLSFVALLMLCRCASLLRAELRRPMLARSMAGHNKWSKIRHKKGAEDQKRAALFSKLSIEISAAAKARRSQLDARRSQLESASRKPPGAASSSLFAPQGSSETSPKFGGIVQMAQSAAGQKPVGQKPRVHFGGGKSKEAGGERQTTLFQDAGDAIGGAVSETVNFVKGRWLDLLRDQRRASMSDSPV